MSHSRVLEFAFACPSSVTESFSEMEKLWLALVQIELLCAKGK